MKKITILLAMALVFAMVLAGCGCSHVWTDATCDTPKTCSQCGETEGAALGHSWNDATCTAPKTCKTCGLTEGEQLDHVWTEASCAAPKTCEVCAQTEGEALEHIWVEANYQAPKTCEACGLTEGEAWPAAFEENGLTINAEQVGVAYPTTIGGKAFTYTIDSYEVVASDDRHQAKEGFEWRIVTHTSQCLEGSAPYNLPTYPDFNNYYDMEGFNASSADAPTSHLYAMTYTVNFNGVEYTDCLFQLEDSYMEHTDTGWFLRETLAFQVPVGFDGMFICLGDAARITGDYYQQYMDLYQDENTLFFRLK